MTESEVFPSLTVTLHCWTIRRVASKRIAVTNFQSWLDCSKSMQVTPRYEKLKYRFGDIETGKFENSNDILVSSNLWNVRGCSSTHCNCHTNIDVKFLAFAISSYKRMQFFLLTCHIVFDIKGNALKI